MENTSNIEVIELPSQGYFYGDKLPGGEIEIYPMTAEEESIIASKKNSKNAHLILDSVVESCLASKFKVDDLLISDELYILLLLRKVSYSPEYNYEVRCPACGEKFKKKVVIPDEFSVTIPDEGTSEPFKIDLPRSGKTVEFRLLRVKDEKEVRKFTRNAYRKSTQKGDPGYTYRLARSIVSVDGEEVNIKEAHDLVKGLIGEDSSYLKTAYGSADCGVNLDMEVECKYCSFEFDTKLTMNKEFFRPVTPEVQFS